MQKQGLLIVLSGFSGVGKGTLVKELIKRYHDKYTLSISATTRKPRVGEEDGREYFFRTTEEFDRMIENNELIEYAVYNGNYYGTPKDFVEQEMHSGKNVILEIEIQGGLQIKSLFPDALLIFVIPPTAEELLKRLTSRGTESREDILRRLHRAVDESSYIAKYDYMTVNDDFEVCLQDILDYTQAQQDRLNKRIEFAELLQNELIALTEKEDAEQ